MTMTGRGGLKDLDIMLNLSKKYIKRGMFLPGNTKNPLYYCEFGQIVIDITILNC